MSLYKKLNSIIFKPKIFPWYLAVCGFAFYVLALLSQEVNQMYREEAPKIYPIKQIKHITLGFDEVVADSLWLRVLQDFDYCENESNEKFVNTGAGVDEVLSVEMKPSRCNKGWVFQMLDLVTDLAPKFKRAYRLGGDVLSVGVDDREGARIIFDKGVSAFPDYWQLAYSASYHYLYEFQNPNKAAQLMLQAANNGGPPWFRQMAGTLYSRAGRFVMAEMTLKKFIHENEGKRSYQQGLMRLQELYDNNDIKKNAKEVIAQEKERMLSGKPLTQ